MKVHSKIGTIKCRSLTPARMHGKVKHVKARRGYHRNPADAGIARVRIKHTLINETYPEEMYGVQRDEITTSQARVQNCINLAADEALAPGMKYDKQRALEVSAYVKLRALGLNIAL